MLALNWLYPPWFETKTDASHCQLWLKQKAPLIADGLHKDHFDGIEKWKHAANMHQTCRVLVMERRPVGMGPSAGDFMIWKAAFGQVGEISFSWRNLVFEPDGHSVGWGPKFCGRYVDKNYAKCASSSFYIGDYAHMGYRYSRFFPSATSTENSPSSSCGLC